MSPDMKALLFLAVTLLLSSCTCHLILSLCTRGIGEQPQEKEEMKEEEPKMETIPIWCDGKDGLKVVMVDF